MTYEIDFMPGALKDLKAIQKTMALRILKKIESMRDDLAGDVKRLTDFTPEY